MTTVPRATRQRDAKKFYSEKRAELMVEWLRHYQANSAFQRELLDLIGENTDALRAFADHAIDESRNALLIGRLPSEFKETAQAYRSALDSFALRWKLDRLHKKRGIQSVHKFNVSHIQFGTELSDFHTFAEYEYSDWEKATNIDDFSLDWFLDMRKPLQLETVAWNPLIEKKAAAKARLVHELKSQIDRELERIAKEFETAGYENTNYRSAQEQHLQWLFQYDVVSREVSRDDAFRQLLGFLASERCEHLVAHLREKLRPSTTDFDWLRTQVMDSAEGIPISGATTSQTRLAEKFRNRAREQRQNAKLFNEASKLVMEFDLSIERDPETVDEAIRHIAKLIGFNRAKPGPRVAA